MKKRIIEIVAILLITVIFIIVVIYKDNQVKTISQLWLTADDKIIGADIMLKNGDIYELNTEETRALYSEVLKIQLNKKNREAHCNCGWEYRLAFHTEIHSYELDFISPKYLQIYNQKYDLESSTALSAWEMTKFLMKDELE